MLAVGVISTIAVGSQLLLGVGSTRVILRAALVSIGTNLVLSLVLVQLIGLVGVFVGTLISALVEIPLLGPEVLRRAGIGGWTFLRTVVMPVVPPVLAQVAVIALAMRFIDGSLRTLVVGGVVGGVVFLLVGLRSAVSVDELRKLRAEFRSPSA